MNGTRGDAARGYAERGWRPLLLQGLRADGKTCTCVKGEKCKSAGKHPVDNEWEKTPAPEEASKPWEGWRANGNVGIATGHPSGIWVLDIDPKKDGAKNAKALEAKYGRLDAKYVVQTGGGGWHLYYEMPPDVDVRNTESKIARGIDVRGTGGQVVAPPSVTDLGPYVVLKDGPPQRAPAWLEELVVKREAEPLELPPETPAVEAGDPRLEAYAERVRQLEVGRLQAMAAAATPDGENYAGEPWNGTTFQVACNLLELANSSWCHYTVEQAYSDLLAHAPTDSGFTSEDINVRWQSAVTKIGQGGREVPPPPDRSAVQEMIDDLDSRNPVSAVPAAIPTSPQTRTWDDIGNGGRFLDWHGRIARYVAESEGWALYEDGRWVEVKSNIVLGMAQKLLAETVPTFELPLYSNIVPAAVGNKQPKSKQQEFREWCDKQRMAARVEACVKMAAGRPGLQASTNDFDTTPHLFNALDTVIDLRTGERVEQAPELMMMKRGGVAYSPLAPCHRWQAFLDRVMPDQEQQAYLQRIVGYSLTGDTTAQAFFIHYGKGANGKSVFLEVLRRAVGDYGQTIPRDALLAKKDSEHPTSIARMKGMRFMEVSETAPGRRLDEEVVKNLTGDANVTARYMGKDFYEFAPTGKIHYITNHLPLLSDADSIWRRLHLIHWGVTIPTDEQNLRLAQEIIAGELAGVFAWAVRGAGAWYAQGLNAPHSMKEALEVYREESDIFGDFLREKTTRGDNLVTPLSEILASYTAWCFISNIKKPMTRQSLSAILKERGFESKRTSSGVAFKGIGLIAQTIDTTWAGL